MLRHRPDWETGGGIALNLGQKNMSPISLYNNKGVKAIHGREREWFS